MSVTQNIITILVVMFGTMFTRFLPFLVFPSAKEPPKYIKYLGTVLPYAVIGMLVVYCLKDAIFTEYHGILEAISILLIVILHKWKKNTLLSIGGGTIFYMILVQNIM